MIEMSDVMSSPSSLRGDLESRRLFRVFNAAFGIFLGAGLVEIFFCGLTVWSNWRFRNDVTLYGWGNVPEERVAIFAFYEKYAPIIDYAPLILLGVAFLLAMGYARRIAQFVGVVFEYSYRWTVGPLFVPFLNLVRPWLGFAEIRRAVLNTAIEGRPTAVGGFSFMTLLLGLAVLINGGIQRQVAADLERLPAPQSAETFYAYMDQLDVLTSLSIGSEVAMLFVMFTYLVTIRASAALIVERVRLRVSG